MDKCKKAEDGEHVLNTYEFYYEVTGHNRNTSKPLEARSKRFNKNNPGNG